MGIAEYLEDSGARVPSGAGWRQLRCPFHEDKNPSASINAGIGRFFCFVCGINEDYIGLIMLREGVTYAEAKQKAAQDSGEGDNNLRGESIPGDWLPNRSRNNQHRRNGSGEAWRSRLT